MDDWLVRDPEEFVASLGLNKQQLEAVTYDPAQKALQILAGPGSGKTKTLTARVAWLILVQKMDPKDIMVITFANKAAREMKERLAKLIGPDLLASLVIGTFHATCVRYLRRHGNLIKIPSNFVISDRDDALALLKPLVNAQKKTFERQHIEPPTPRAVQDIISRSKAVSKTPEALRLEAEKSKNNLNLIVADIFEGYNQALAKAGALDFDDLLLRGLELVTRHERVLANLRCVLVDEFQDTNLVQYSLLKKFAKKATLTTVGDPDQSIYAFRAAQSEVIDFMCKDFPTAQVFLEENYRSTSGILAASMGVISQDQRRIQRKLFTSETSTGLPVCVRSLSNARNEASYIAHEIKRLRAQTGNQLGFDDFAILLRFNALSRVLEAALQGAGIPHRVLGGSKFFDRMEVKDIIAYLQLANSPHYEPAFDRAINCPKRSMGPSTVAQIKEAAVAENIPSIEVLRRAIHGATVAKFALKPAQKRSMKGFVGVIAEVKRLADDNTSVSKLIYKVMELTDYEGHLERTTPMDVAPRLENIKELQAFAVQIEKDNAEPGEMVDEAILTPSQRPPFDDVEPQGSGMDEGKDIVFSGIASGDDEGNIDESRLDTDILKVDTKLQTFLSSCMLSTDTQIDDSDNNKPKVTISTVHSAKGLEWPCVFVPACEDGVFPFYKAKSEKEIDEERRLLYVAMTRAQASLQVTRSTERQIGPRLRVCEISPYLKGLDPGLFAQSLPAVTDAQRDTISKLLKRNQVGKEELTLAIENFDMSLPAHLPWDQEASSQPASSYASSYSGSGGGRYSGSSFTAGTQSSYRAPSSQSYMTGVSGGGGFRAGAAVKPRSGLHTSQSSQPTSGQLSTGFSSARSLMSSQSRPNFSQPSSVNLDNVRMSSSSSSSAGPSSQHSLASFQSFSNDSIEQLRNLGKNLDEGTSPGVVTGSKRGANSDTSSSKRSRQA